MWLSLAVSAVVAQSAAVPANVEVVTLGNGMRWVLLPRADHGLVSGLVTVRAGGVHEAQGETGVAHLLEHLAFAGTPIVGSTYGWEFEGPVQQRALDLTHELANEARQGRPGGVQASAIQAELFSVEQQWHRLSDSTAFRRLMGSHDIQLNAWTTKDTTTYWGEFPRAQLHFWLAAEAQRFAAPVFRDFRTEREVVLQELRDRQSPLSGGFDVLCQLAFEGSGYAWSVGGREADVRAMSPRTLDAFYERLYSPQNAVGALVGEFDPADARVWLEQTFAQIPSRAVGLPARVAFTAPTATRVRAAQQMVLLGFETPSDLEPQAALHALLRYLLTTEDGVLSGLDAEGNGLISASSLFAGPGLLDRHLQVIALELGPKKDPLAAQARFFKALASWTPTEGEVARAARALERQRLQELRSRRTLAAALATQLLFTGDWREVFSPRFTSFTAASVVELARSLTVDKAWIVELTP